jgi:hypothetical protein
MPRLLRKKIEGVIGEEALLTSRKIHRRLAPTHALLHMIAKIFNDSLRYQSFTPGHHNGILSDTHISHSDLTEV